MVIYKKVDDASPWTPWAYFSSNCLTYFNMPYEPMPSFSRPDEVICREEYSTLQPLYGGDVIFSVINGRPGADDFFHNPELTGDEVCFLCFKVCLCIPSANFWLCFGQFSFQLSIDTIMSHPRPPTLKKVERLQIQFTETTLKIEIIVKPYCFIIRFSKSVQQKG